MCCKYNCLNLKLNLSRITFYAQFMESCSAATDCGPGLYCGNCPVINKNQPICTRGQANIPTSFVMILSLFHFMPILYDEFFGNFRFVL